MRFNNRYFQSGSTVNGRLKEAMRLARAAVGVANGIADAGGVRSSPPVSFPVICYQPILRNHSLEDDQDRDSSPFMIRKGSQAPREGAGGSRERLMAHFIFNPGVQSNLDPEKPLDR